MIGFICIALMPNCNLDFNFRIGRKHVLCRSRREPNVHARYWRQGGYRVKQGNLTHCWREFSVESLDTVSLLEIVCFLTRDARETENPTLFFSLEEVPVSPGRLSGRAPRGSGKSACDRRAVGSLFRAPSQPIR